ncbi:phenylalanine--tRNA ligase beta subunit-related protein [Telmatospirillum sp.]|uniref:B3/B4 domain-containing protein n=1 Tax=Telmatospirillum sp. TaxID=2079197 RepID=UPI00284DC8FA|nr:phenylalanine--tRNA ligase beta subunit-related protein [Telmatospirillum sp.]MDR3437439.1 phenylalanine--tRNA ligase beta subunit-related protein [Telmatospirillum sp.]
MTHAIIGPPASLDRRRALRFHLDPDVTAKGVTGSYCLLLGVDQTGANADAIEAFVDQAVASVRARARRDLISADPILAGFRTLHRAFGVPTRKLFSAPETLIRYVEKRGDIPRIGPLVDLYNAVSLETGLALGAHDIAQIDGDISLRMTTGSENFHPVGAAEPEPVRPGEYAYVDDGGTVICRLEVRQVEKTKVTPETTDVFLIIQGNPATPPQTIRAGQDRLVSVLQRFLGGTEVPLYRP